ncbi:MFS general substrate transporter [Polychaeton citri CBS 116435]|uniref:MFS general substrate transporter n=1 Tax=Polychaeton citri CBS 116435 TaxID=1314669 RepID=A0A9P4UPF7_9PEZI|nr:MFS general substrate transporter [Polychaeton citri CBS 116435]
MMVGTSEKPVIADISAHARSGTKTEPSEVEAGTSRKKPWSFYLAFLSLVLMVLVVSLDATTLPVALPVITRKLHGTTVEAFWAGLSFILLVALTQPLYTTFSDVIGRKTPLFIAFVLFAVGSIVFATAKSMSVVILGRALQGLGGGGLDVLNEAILADITTIQERPLYIGLMAIPIAAGSIAGPIIGACFTEEVNWQWIGWINLPIVGVSAILAILFLQLKPVERPLRPRLARMDFIGMILFIAGGTAFAIPLSLGGAVTPWRSWKILLPLIIGFVLLIGFAIYEGRPTVAMFPYRVFRSRSAQAAALTGFLHGMVTYPLLFWLPLFFQAILLATPLHSAVLILPLCCSLIGFSLLSGILLDLTRQSRLQLWFAWLVVTLGLGLFSLWNIHTSVAEMAGFQILAGAGIGVMYTVGPLIMQASVEDPDDQGLAVGILVCFRLFGGLIGLAIGSSAFSSVFNSSIASVGPLPASVTVQQDPSAAVGFIPDLRGLSLTPQVRDDVQMAYLDAMRVIWYILTGFSGIGLISSLFVKEASLHQGEGHAQQQESSD